MKCKVCGEEVVLVPSAAERASTFGKTAKFYEELFPVHAECVLRQRTAETSRLMAVCETVKLVDDSGGEFVT